MGDVVMPRLSDSMEEGTILKWLKAPGEEVRRGEGLVEIETDKATMTYEADADGALEIVAAEGDTLPIGTLIARIGESDGGAPTAAPPGVGGLPADSQPKDSPPPTAPPKPRPEPGDRTKASPLARRIARERNVPIESLTGTGPGGRIVRADVEKGAPAAAAGEATGSAPPERARGADARGSAGRSRPEPEAEGGPADPRAGAPTTAPPSTSAKGETTTVELTRTQQLVARRMAESKATVPDFTLTADVDMEAAVELRVELKALGGDDPPPSYNDMVVRACALALREHPRANGAYRDGRFELYSRVNVGVAVAAQDALVVPTVFDADQRTLADIARTTRTLAERVRSGEVTPPELSGGTFTVSNLGMYGVTSFTAVINPPQAAILAVGALARRAVPVEDAIVPRHVMPVTLACDHRILYGADAAQFLASIRALLERPLALLV